MAKAYYSTIFECPADDIWKIIRDFNNYPVWVGGAGESRIEGGKSGDTVGAVRSVLYQGRRIRQRLLAQSDVERTRLTNSARRQRCRWRGFGERCGSHPSPTATGLLSNGGPILTAILPAAVNSPRPCKAGSENGCSRCVKRWRRARRSSPPGPIPMPGSDLFGSILPKR